MGGAGLNIEMEKGGKEVCGVLKAFQRNQKCFLSLKQYWTECDGGKSGWQVYYYCYIILFIFLQVLNLSGKISKYVCQKKEAGNCWSCELSSWCNSSRSSSAARYFLALPREPQQRCGKLGERGARPPPLLQPERQAPLCFTKWGDFVINYSVSVDWGLLLATFFLGNSILEFQQDMWPPRIQVTFPMLPCRQVQ